MAQHLLGVITILVHPALQEHPPVVQDADMGAEALNGIENM
jgi:hypothetical protein